MDLRKSLGKKLLQLISGKGKYSDHPSIDSETIFKLGLASSAEFFNRFKGKVDFKNKTILDIGCGLGSTCYYVVLNGATSAVGVDIRPDDIKFAQSKISEYPSIENKIEFKLTADLNFAQYDIVLSKDSFEHYQNPERFISIMKSRLKPNGKMVIGFSPLWKSPYGAHSWSFSSWPWIHLIFSESVVLGELRRYFENDKITYENWASGLNRMTVNRYLRIVQENDLRTEYIKFNVSSSIKSRLVFTFFNGLRLIPGLREYFTVNLYSILQINEETKEIE